MRVCLITAATVTEFQETVELESESVRTSALEPQLGILSLAAVLEGSNCDLRLLNLNRTFLNYKESSVASPPDFSMPRSSR